MLFDITQIKQYEQEMARLDCINLVGEMAASIGHEVRNPMTTVREYLQLFDKRPEFVNSHTQILTMIEELDRANSIIAEFLSLAKNQTLEQTLGNINNVLEAMLPLLQAEVLRSGHSIQTNIRNIPDIIMDARKFVNFF
ncbi:histidine kinase dimerization/phospho-acceptor domain-containing protein [Sporomusa aerivorans]|uniref:histidine kinase dimerization/phospho-acceptor domain-containing protein n=1 Tax=Sporomusa aerivorans TaxID=204936 RepID=UPI00352B4F3F